MLLRFQPLHLSWKTRAAGLALLAGLCGAALAQATAPAAPAAPAADAAPVATAQALAPAPVLGAAGGELSIRQVYDRLESAGYRDIREIEWDDGRYEVKARSPRGELVKMKVDARTAAVLRSRIDY